MTTPLTLSTAPFDYPDLDYAQLRQEGIRHIERMAGQLWSDFNAHDPGLTILEQLCYAITDLAYRIDYEIPDLLASDPDTTANSLYAPAQILPTYPVTLNDLRKLVIDVPEVKNAWVENADAGGIKGLYRVLVEKFDLPSIDDTEAAQRVGNRLHAYRPVGEDIEAIEVLDTQPVRVRADIEIGPTEQADQILLAIYQQLNASISPTVPFLTLSEMLQAGKPVEEIFDGPLLEHGFIDDQSLLQTQRRTQLHTSDLIHDLMDIPGVQAVRVIRLAVEGSEEEVWVLALDENKAPKYDAKKSCIQLLHNRLTASVERDEIRAIYELERQAAAVRPQTPDASAPQGLAGRDRHIDNYYSIQHQFPDVYALGAAGLPTSAEPQRQAQAKQLKAYLLFFDQLLANYFAQLAHVKTLFSFYDFASGEPPRTYFANIVDDASLGLDDIRRCPDTHQDRLQEITEDPATAYERRNHFLNHLLARFAEQFTDYALLCAGMIPNANDKLVQDKQTFLQQYGDISRARGSAINYLLPRAPNNISGLQQRIRLKLGLTDDEPFEIIEHILLRPIDGAELDLPPIFAESPAPYSLQLSFLFPDSPTRFQNESFQQFVEQTVREETPVHLIPYIWWLSEPDWTTNIDAYEACLEQRRDFWTNRYGISEP